MAHNAWHCQLPLVAHKMLTQLAGVINGCFFGRNVIGVDKNYPPEREGMSDSSSLGNNSSRIARW